MKDKPQIVESLWKQAGKRPDPLNQGAWMDLHQGAFQDIAAGEPPATVVPQAYIIMRQ